MKLKIAVCDDDLQWSERIRQSISEYMCHVNQQCDIQVFESGEELCGAFHGSHSFDIVFWMLIWMRWMEWKLQK